MAITETRTIDTGELFDGPRATGRPAVRGKRGAIAAGHHLAALAGQRILDRGGNAIDAGVTAGICIGILLPDLVNVGGVAPIILHEAASGDTHTIAGVGRWPKMATIDAVRDEKTGNLARDLRQCVTPAAMDAWLLALDRFGTMGLDEILADPIDLCENGFVMYDLLATAVAARAKKLGSARPMAACCATKTWLDSTCRWSHPSKSSMTSTSCSAADRGRKVRRCPSR
jgi:gamma-glutamyltranspeptidase